MNTKFEQSNINPERQIRWNTISAQVEQITDKLGKPVDGGIKEAVVAFMVNDLTTESSCEGHLDWGYPYPSVFINHSLKSPEFREKVLALTTEVTAKGYEGIQNIPKEDAELYSRFVELRSEYEGYEKEVEAKIHTLLKEFYSVHTPISSDYVLIAWKGGSFLAVEPISGAGVGKENHEKFKARLKAMPPEEKGNYLKNSQAEMAVFTSFLKEKFLEEK